jgi:hypothetical protein
VLSIRTRLRMPTFCSSSHSLLWATSDSGGILNTAYRLCKVLLGQHTHLTERLCQATTLLVSFRARGYFWPCIPIPGGWRSLGSSAGLRDQCSCLSASSSMPNQKSGRHAGPRLEVVGQTTFQAYTLKDWPFKVNLPCARLYLPLRVSLPHRRLVWSTVNF